MLFDLSSHATSYIDGYCSATGSRSRVLPLATSGSEPISAKRPLAVGKRGHRSFRPRALARTRGDRKQGARLDGHAVGRVDNAPSCDLARTTSALQPQDIRIRSIAVPTAGVVDALGSFRLVTLWEFSGLSPDGSRRSTALAAGWIARCGAPGWWVAAGCDPGGPCCFMAWCLPIRSLGAGDAAKAQAQLRLRSSRARFRLLRRCRRRPSQSRRGW